MAVAEAVRTAAAWLCGGGCGGGAAAHLTPHRRGGAAAAIDSDNVWIVAVAMVARVLSAVPTPLRVLGVPIALLCLRQCP